MSTETNVYGIPTEPETALESVKNGTIKATEDPSEVVDGPIVELFSITVKDGDKTFYDSNGAFQPFGWTKVSSLPAVLENEGAELEDSSIEALDAIFSTEKNLKAIKALVSTYNSVQRANAKQAEYARITGLKKPMSEETKTKKVESTVAFFAAMHGISLDAARTKLAQAGLI